MTLYAEKIRAKNQQEIVVRLSTDGGILVRGASQQSKCTVHVPLWIFRAAKVKNPLLA
jgi:hypothetical protein